METFKDAFVTNGKIEVSDPVNGMVTFTVDDNLDIAVVTLDRHTFQDFIRHLNQLTWQLNG